MDSYKAFQRGAKLHFKASFVFIVELDHRKEYAC